MKDKGHGIAAAAHPPPSLHHIQQQDLFGNEKQMHDWVDLRSGKMVYEKDARFSRRALLFIKGRRSEPGVRKMFAVAETGTY